MELVNLNYSWGSNGFDEFSYSFIADNQTELNETRGNLISLVNSVGSDFKKETESKCVDGVFSESLVFSYEREVFPEVMILSSFSARTKGDFKIYFKTSFKDLSLNSRLYDLITDLENLTIGDEVKGYLKEIAVLKKERVSPEEFYLNANKN